MYDHVKLCVLEQLVTERKQRVHSIPKEWLLGSLTRMGCSPALMKDGGSNSEMQRSLFPFFTMSTFLLENSATGIGSTFLGLGLFHCCSLSVHIRNSGIFPDAQNSTSA